MRKIEEQMVAAIRYRNAWKSGNTAVTPTERQDGKPLVIVTLHGHHIATIGYTKGTRDVVSVSVSLAGWNTRTTRSRLDAIIREFARNGGQGLGVSSTQRHGLRLHDYRGVTPITSTAFHSVEL